MNQPCPIYFVGHPDGSYSVADPQPIELPNVPLEVAPSKENAPPVSQCTWFDRPHPEPVIRCEFQQGHEGPCSFQKAYDPRTQQKETPTMPYGAGAQNFGASPEGVQEKEPQTPEPIFKTHHCDKCGVFGYGEQKTCPVCTARSEGEAAGRRSVITELQEWLERVKVSWLFRTDVIAKCAELREKTK